MRKHYDEIKECKLSDIFLPNQFRLVNYEEKDVPHGISEIVVLMDLKKDFGKKLSYKIPWDGQLFGFVRNKKQIYKNIGTNTPKKLTISDWDDKCVFIFEDENGKEGPVFSVSKEEIADMLEKCIRPNNFKEG